ncbi:hypothetical protein [Sphingomonas sp. ID1715]|uniref:hypothetical protein n=1 Tax=Sphingomonas sp. ID1715 TaxID=1656898 RepID=UPI001C2BC175|nr:hypothetical protein [Sphingomonas sp. ID1715]
MDALCPSASADAAGARAFGLVGGDADRPRVAYLAEPVPVTEDLKRAAAPVTLEEVARTSAPCGGNACRHYDGADCTLVRRIVSLLDPAVARPPACSIRGQCRWWAQEGKAACLRCPQIVTQSMNETRAYQAAMTPPSQGAFAC